MIKKYREIPNIVEALRYDGMNVQEIKNFIGDSLNLNIIDKSNLKTLFINGLLRDMRCNVGDYIVKSENVIKVVSEYTIKTQYELTI